MKALTPSACAVLLVAAPALLAPVAHADEPNDAFADVTVHAPAVLVVEDELDPGAAIVPVTTLGVFDPVGNLTGLDDGSDPRGDNLNSLLFNPIGFDGGIRLAVSGAPDFDFDGLADPDPAFFHGQAGQVEIRINVFSLFGSLADSFTFEEFIRPGEVLDINLANPAWFGGEFDVTVEPGLIEDGDYTDFHRFTGLTPGAQYEAEVFSPFPDLDTLLGLFDDQGELIDADDDGGDGLLSKLTFTAGPSGEATIAVGQFDDFLFENDPSVIDSTGGFYTLQLTELPAGLVGDLNGDGFVGAGDLDILLGVWNQAVADSAADLNGDGFIGAGDLDILLGNWNASLDPGAAPVPEPAAAVVLGLALASMSAARRRA